MHGRRARCIPFYQLHWASVTGRRLSIPLLRYPIAEHLFCTGSARSRHLMVSVEDRPTNLGRVVVLPLPNVRSDLIRRPGEGLRFGKPMSCAARNPLNSPCQAATAAEANSVPSTSMRCMITASLRASATFAFFMPARLASRIAQLLRAVNRGSRSLGRGSAIGCLCQSHRRAAQDGRAT